MKPSLLILLTLAIAGKAVCEETSVSTRPNILIAMSDDQSFPHTSASGCTFVNTPAFDRIAAKGVLFNNAMATSPGCAPSRSSLLLGRYPWQNEHAGNHSALWPKKYIPFTDILEENGYCVGYTGKGVIPFVHSLGGRDLNPAGHEYNEFRNHGPATGIEPIDYARNFSAFLDERKAGQPFCFMYTSKEPHRSFELGSGKKHGKQIKDVDVPSFLPDTEEVRSDLLDYAYEIEWFDLHLERILATLEKHGELENTIVIVTSDNGMAFPGSKAICTEYGIHVPLAVSWGNKISGGRVIDDPVSLIDIYPTLFEILNLPLPEKLPVAGQSMASILFSEKAGSVDPSRTRVFASRERHSFSRWKNLGYPQRTIRTSNYLYTWNFYPERWPAGAPEQLRKNKLVTGFTDVDEAGNGIRHTPGIMPDERNKPSIKPFFQRCFDKRPQEELFDIKQDPGCMTNLADQPDFEEIKKTLHKQLFDYLEQTQDPRVVGANADIFDSYKRYAGTRSFPEPEWVKLIDPDKLKHLLDTVEQDNDPIVFPDSIGEWGLKMGRWELLKVGRKWELYDITKDPEKTKDLSTQKYRIVKDLVTLYKHSINREQN